MATEFTGIVLAGGRSSRMGRDKATLPWAGATLLDCMIEKLQRAGASSIRVSGDRTGYGGVPDAWPGQGPVGGIASVLRRCTDGIAVVVPVDLPLLDPLRLVALADAAAAHGATGYAGHPLPCAMRVDAMTRRLVEDLMADSSDGPSVRRLLHALGAVELAVDGHEGLRPCNSPADWAAIAR